MAKVSKWLAGAFGVSVLVLGCSSSGKSDASPTTGSCLQSGFSCSAGQTCCDGSNQCPAGKCASPTPQKCAPFAGCQACAAQVGCGFCRSTSKCLDQFGEQGPNWDSCADLAVDPPACSAPPAAGQTTPGTSNTPAQCSAGPVGGDTSAAHCSTCVGGALCVGSSGPPQYSGGDGKFYACSPGGTCCGPWGHPEISCPAGSSCAASGGCTKGPQASVPGAGASCSKDGDCTGSVTLHCDTSQHACVSGLGAPCASSSDCIVSAFCSKGGTCLAAGTCAVDGDCDPMHVCANGVCQVSTPTGGPGGPSTCTDGGAHCSTLCSKGNIPQQACFYCEAACACDCAQESCGDANRMLALMYGTKCPP